MVPAIDHPAQFLTCHSHVPLGALEKFPMRSRRNERVRNGMDPIKVTRSMRGDKARRKGLDESIEVASFKIDEAVWISSGR